MPKGRKLSCLIAFIFLGSAFWSHLIQLLCHSCSNRVLFRASVAQPSSVTVASQK
ncbi:hypothetical protein BDW71DRAFT_182233 [Aspergillus fruticulosus]